MADLGAEVVVVGAGIAGAATAYHLAARGADVILLDRHYPASGPTGRSAAITHAFYLEPELSQLARQGSEQLRLMPEWLGHPSDYRACGMMWACGPATASTWSVAVERIQGEGSRIQAISPAQLADRAPGLELSGLAMGVWEPDGGYADPATATNSFVTAAQQRGAQLLVKSPVVELLAIGERVVGVRLEDGRVVEAGTVVVATGPWTRELVRQVGVELPLFIQRHAIALLDLPGKAAEMLPFCWCDDTLENYARPEGKHLIIAGLWEGAGTTASRGPDKHDHIDAPDRLKSSVALEESEQIVRTLVPRIPRMEELGIRDGYAALFDVSPDHRPLIGAVPGLEGIYVVAGSSGHGFKLGPAVGEEVARELTEEPSSLLEPFRLDRSFPSKP